MLLLHRQAGCVCVCCIFVCCILNLWDTWSCSTSEPQCATETKGYGMSSGSQWYGMSMGSSHKCAAALVVFWACILDVS
jgi:hypothetical protein